jgi:hypothetical protein
MMPFNIERIQPKVSLLLSTYENPISKTGCYLQEILEKAEYGANRC